MAAITETAPIEVGALIVSTPGTVGWAAAAGWHADARPHAGGIPPVRKPHCRADPGRGLYAPQPAAGVYAALAYCYANREQIEQIWDEDERFMEAFVRKYPEGRWGPDNDRGMPELDDQTA